MADYFSADIHSVRYTPTFLDRLFGLAKWMEEVNIRNAFIQNQEEDLQILRQGVLDLQSDAVLAREAKYLDEIGILKARVGGLESEVRTVVRQNNELSDELAVRKRQSIESNKRVETRMSGIDESMLIKPERALALGRSIQGRGHVEPNSGAHSASGAIHSTPQDGGSGLLIQAAVLHAVLASDSSPTRSEPAYCAPEPSRSEPSYSDSSSGASGGGGGGGD